MVKVRLLYPMSTKLFRERGSLLVNEMNAIGEGVSLDEVVAMWSSRFII